MVPKSLTEEGTTLGPLLRKAVEALIREVYEGGLAEAGFPDLRPAHGAVLRHMPANGARATDLALRAGMRKQSMGYLLDDLQTLGYVESVGDPDDRRARIVCFTDRGREAQAAAARISAAAEARWASALGARDWAVTRRTLERLGEIVEEEAK